ncbi:MAG: helix-turn-helix domain-containing protein [Dehalococcoidia bacterium]
MMLKVKVKREVVELAIIKTNLSQNVFAEKAGISPAFMSQIMCGVRSPSGRIRQKLLDALSPLAFDDVFIIEREEHGGPTHK